MPTAAVRIPLPVETGFDAGVVEEAAERRIAEGLARLDAQRASPEQSQIANAIEPLEGIATEYDVEVTSDGLTETVTITMTGNSIPVVTASTRDAVQTWAQAQAMKIWQDRVARSWMASTTSSTTAATTINLGSSWHIRTTGTSSTTGWYDIEDGCTAAANAAWYSTGWQDCKHTQVRWTPSVVQRTPEQIAEAAAKAELARQAAIIEAAKVKIFTDTAKARARKLLFSMLNTDQQKELEEKNFFHLTVHDRSGSMRVYRIEHGYAGNVKLIGVDGQPVKRYCIHADYRLPYEDQMLAQKLMLETNEPEFLRIANMTQLRAA